MKLITGLCDDEAPDCYSCPNPCQINTTCVACKIDDYKGYCITVHSGEQRKCQGWYRGVKDCKDLDPSNIICTETILYGSLQDCQAREQPICSSFGYGGRD